MSRIDFWNNGLYVLTSNTKLKAQQIIDGYKDLWQVEHAFRQLKTELATGQQEIAKHSEKEFG